MNINFGFSKISKNQAKSKPYQNVTLDQYNFYNIKNTHIKTTPIEPQIRIVHKNNKDIQRCTNMQSKNKKDTGNTAETDNLFIYIKVKNNMEQIQHVKCIIITQTDQKNRSKKQNQTKKIKFKSTRKWTEFEYDNHFFTLHKNNINIIHHTYY
jgi:hypothetical protein